MADPMEIPLSTEGEELSKTGQKSELILQWPFGLCAVFLFSDNQWQPDGTKATVLLTNTF